MIDDLKTSFSVNICPWDQAQAYLIAHMEHSCPCHSDSKGLCHHWESIEGVEDKWAVL